MSKGELSLLLSPQAEDDFADILQYTLEAWGENQVYVYRSVLDKALTTIQQNPELVIGRQRFPQSIVAFKQEDTSLFIELHLTRSWCLAYFMKAWIMSEIYNAN